MASGKSSTLDRLKHKLFPFLFKRCPAGNIHGIRDRLCYCRVNEHDYDWAGGTYSFKYHPQVKAFLRKEGKAISEYSCTEDILNDFAEYLGTTKI